MARLPRITAMADDTISPSDHRQWVGGQLPLWGTFMIIRSNVSSFFAGIAGVVVGAVAFGGVAYAANGGSFLLGKTNKATAPSVLNNSAGTALSLVAKPGYAPFKVSNAVKVPLLNADKLDGLDSKSFVRVGATVANATNASKLAGKDESAFALATAKVGRVASTGTTAVDFDADFVTDYYLAIATCPAGSLMTGGGFIGVGMELIGSLPTSGNTWQVASVSSSVTAYATCLSLRGTLPTGVAPLSLSGATTNTATTKALVAAASR